MTQPNSDQQPPPPPPLPNIPNYQTPNQKTGREIGHLGDAQKVFDTVTGPNLRLKDNVIQLISVFAGIIIAIPIFMAFIKDTGGAIVLGILAGMLGGIIISGIALGIYRFIHATKKK